MASGSLLPQGSATVRFRDCPFLTKYNNGALDFSSQVTLVFLISVTGAAVRAFGRHWETGHGLRSSLSIFIQSPGVHQPVQSRLLHSPTFTMTLPCSPIPYSPSYQGLLPRQLGQPFSAAPQAVSLPFPIYTSPKSQSRLSL